MVKNLGKIFFQILYKIGLWWHLHVVCRKFYCEITLFLLQEDWEEKKKRKKAYFEALGEKVLGESPHDI